ncbi:translation initiation factor IF-2 [Desulfuribacillus alkaliarsenatis]|uniref:Translation initiation factor IF-2 n=1 Tax=Desulfuribacillus alkaliarsenatis TaxID=766136 RepID=A0A1E5G643_9FIRM|nr:translation initiation factor IF-2 [Desulfuribacillus alkaliarsenatis]OEF98646.1 translation initiation factor IF-2 [Desulfuribacillus alkaliarsenatis]
MSKIRIYEYAKEVNMSSKEIIEIMKRLNKTVGNHMSIIDKSDINDIENYMKQLKSKTASKQTDKKSASAGHKKPAHNDTANNTAQNRQSSTNNDTRTSNNQRRDYSQQKTSQNRSHNTTQNRSQNTAQSTTHNRSQNATHNRAQNTTQNRPQNTSQQTNKRHSEKPKTTEAVKDSRTYNKPNESLKEKPSKKTDRFSDTRDINGIRKNKSKRHNKGKQAQPKKVNTEPPKTPAKITYKGDMTVGDLAKALKKEPSEIIKKLMFLGVMATINQELDLETITLICEEYGVAVEEKIELPLEEFETITELDEEKDLKIRPPVVTIMGHVDHGKTTLLDTIRHTKVTEGEAGGITQHIGAYQVRVNDKKISFLDTPGHAAFTSMRARGAKITDITILVVAADDGVMPQTVEAINHAKAAGVPIIVAVNKIDKPDANPDRVKQELTEYELIPEEWGGSTIFVNISAKNNQGIEDLLEMVLLVAEVEELKANPNKRARGTVIESQLDKGRGSLATVLVQSGTLKIGDAIIIGNAYGRVRAMINDQGKRVRTADPSMPVEITGMSEVPNAGDQFIVVEDDKTARVIAEKRQMKERQETLGISNKITLDDLYKQIKEGTVKDLNVILKADVHGSVEALRGALEKIDIEGVQVKTVHTGVGAITESDVILASASNAIIIGFNVRPQPNAKKTAEHENVDIRLHSIIYKAIEEIEAALKGLLDPEYKEVVLGHAEVRQIIKVSKVGSIAGSYVLDGKIIRDKKARVIRDGIVIFEGEMSSLKRFKDDVKEVNTGYECGITIDKYNDFQEGDIIEVFDMQKVERA